MGTCHVCPEGEGHVPDEDMLAHLRCVHPDLYGTGPERWPDGGLVVTDCTLRPEDFTENP